MVLTRSAAKRVAVSRLEGDRRALSDLSNLVDADDFSPDAHVKASRSSPFKTESTGNQHEVLVGECTPARILPFAEELALSTSDLKSLTGAPSLTDLASPPGSFHDSSKSLRSPSTLANLFSSQSSPSGSLPATALVENPPASSDENLRIAEAADHAWIPCEAESPCELGKSPAPVFQSPTLASESSQNRAQADSESDDVPGDVSMERRRESIDSSALGIAVEADQTDREQEGSGLQLEKTTLPPEDKEHESKIHRTSSRSVSPPSRRISQNSDMFLTPCLGSPEARMELLGAEAAADWEGTHIRFDVLGQSRVNVVPRGRIFDQKITAISSIPSPNPRRLVFAEMEKEPDTAELLNLAEETEAGSLTGTSYPDKCKRSEPMWRGTHTRFGDDSSDEEDSDDLPNQQDAYETGNAGDSADLSSISKSFRRVSISRTTKAIDHAWR
mmetsp:Transcript_34782/g.137195  ORF Transcript_34782/g.137195 Transcript_34782/m.137195 type:complete len:445 (-) Transcript_34782:112-1446(-)